MGTGYLEPRDEDDTSWLLRRVTALIERNTFASTALLIVLILPLYGIARIVALLSSLAVGAITDSAGLPAWALVVTALLFTFWPLPVGVWLQLRAYRRHPDSRAAYAYGVAFFMVVFFAADDSAVASVLPTDIRGAYTTAYFACLVLIAGAVAVWFLLERARERTTAKS
jgi:hypothetical protein